MRRTNGDGCGGAKFSLLRSPESRYDLAVEAMIREGFGKFYGGGELEIPRRCLFLGSDSLHAAAFLLRQFGLRSVRRGFFGELAPPKNSS